MGSNPEERAAAIRYHRGCRRQCRCSFPARHWPSPPYPKPIRAHLRGGLWHPPLNRAADCRGETSTAVESITASSPSRPARHTSEASMQGRRFGRSSSPGSGSCLGKACPLSVCARCQMGHIQKLGVPFVFRVLVSNGNTGDPLVPSL